MLQGQQTADLLGGTPFANRTMLDGRREAGPNLLCKERIQTTPRTQTSEGGAMYAVLDGPGCTCSNSMHPGALFDI